MLDAFKSLTGGKGKVQQQTDELKLLIANAREERSAISAMLNTLANRSAKLAPLGKQLEQVTEKATRITDRLDDIAKRLTALDDVRINLEMLGEQKAVVDHVAEKAAQLEFMLQEARNTQRNLQHERELAERIEQGIKQLRSKKGPGAEDGKSRTA